MDDTVNNTARAEDAARAAVAQEPSQRLAEQIEDVPAADGAEVLHALTPEQAADVAEYLDPNTAADVLAEMDSADAAQVIEGMEAPEASMVLAAMDPDDRVDILGHLTIELHDQLVGELSAEDAAEVRQLEKYPPDTAGGIMTTDVTALYEYLTVENAIQLLRKMSEELEQMFYVYVIDRRQHLVGVLSMRDLILARPERRLRDIMIANVRSVPATMDQEEVAALMSRYGYLAMPVVDERGRLAGLITHDDVLEVIQEEAREDVQRLFGAGAEERLTSPWHFSFRRRIVWLEVNLLTAFLAASVVGFFESTIAKVAIIAMYMPVVAGMGGNASAQAMAVAIRGIALGEADGRIILRVLRNQLIVGFLSGAVIGVSAMLISLVFHYRHGTMLGLLAGLALLINHTLACIWGVAIPFAMKRLGFDPAQSATIFTTTLTDVLGFFTLLGLAWLFLQ